MLEDVIPGPCLVLDLHRRGTRKTLASGDYDVSDLAHPICRH